MCAALTSCRLLLHVAANARLGRRRGAERRREFRKRSLGRSAARRRWAAVRCRIRMGCVERPCSFRSSLATEAVPCSSASSKRSRILGNRKCDGVTSVTFHPGNAASTSLRFTPRISGRLRFGHTSSSTVASDTVIAPTSRPIAARWASFKSWKVPVSSTSRKPEPMPAARKSVTSPCTSRISTPACRTRSRARRRAFSTMSIPVTCQPRFARWIPQMPLPVPRSSAGTVRYLASFLLAVEQFGKFRRERRIGVLPGMEADGVSQFPVHGAVFTVYLSRPS